jgi:hypothetical protein
MYGDSKGMCSRQHNTVTGESSQRNTVAGEGSQHNTIMGGGGGPGYGVRRTQTSLTA